jgi:hypothetical protein
MSFIGSLHMGRAILSVGDSEDTSHATVYCWHHRLFPRDASADVLPNSRPTARRAVERRLGTTWKFAPGTLLADHLDLTLDQQREIFRRHRTIIVCKPPMVNQLYRKVQ